MYESVLEILKTAFDEDIANNILSSYKEIQDSFLLKKWKPAELDSGHFVESVRRAIEKKLFNSYTKFNQKLPNFNDAALQSYENSHGDDSYRMLIPRALKSVYNIRNKRGAGHIGEISANEMDATYILYTVKWVLSELIRLETKLSIEDTQKLVNSIVKRQIEIVWENKSSVKRILDRKILVSDQVLIFLLEENGTSAEILINSIEYKNKTNFLKLLKRLHKNRYIDYSNQICEITPLGIQKAEMALLKSKL